jgi:hypothetical protein
MDAKAVSRPFQRRGELVDLRFQGVDEVGASE